MKLTGRTLAAFESWLKKQPYANFNRYTKLIIIHGKVYTDYNELFIDTLIINFLDSVGFKIIILPTMFIDYWGCDIFGWTECEKSGLVSRVSAQNAAIEKANELYNNSPQK